MEAKDITINSALALVAVHNGLGRVPHGSLGLLVHIDAPGVAGPEGSGQELLQNPNLMSQKPYS